MVGDLGDTRLELSHGRRTKRGWLDPCILFMVNYPSVSIDIAWSAFWTTPAAHVFIWIIWKCFLVDRTTLKFGNRFFEFFLSCLYLRFPWQIVLRHLAEFHWISLILFISQRGLTWLWSRRRHWITSGRSQRTTTVLYFGLLFVITILIFVHNCLNSVILSRLIYRRYFFLFFVFPFFGHFHFIARVSTIAFTSVS